MMNPELLDRGRMKPRPTAPAAEPQERERSRSPGHSPGKSILEALLAGFEAWVKQPASDPGFQAFLAHRTQRGPWNKPTGREKRGKELRFDKCTPEEQAALVAARGKEWENWVRYKSITVFTPEEGAKLAAAGTQIVPTRWVELDKNESLRTTGAAELPFAMKSRLVVTGDLETSESRTDAPTSSSLSHNLVLSFAASKGVGVAAADISAA